MSRALSTCGGNTSAIKVDVRKNEFLTAGYHRDKNSAYSTTLQI